MSNKNCKTGGQSRREFLGRLAGASWAAQGASLLMPVGSAMAAVGGAAGQRGPVTRQPLYWSWWGWEPLAHYRRAGGIVGAVDTSAPGLERWYDRMHSEEIVRTMSAMGINLACTHFFKGFGLVAERPEQRRTAELVRLAHKHGMKVLGYCQSRSLYHETFVAEEPAAESWIQRDGQGRLRTWGRAAYRWAPCILSGEFREYMKRAIRTGIEDVGLDGFHFDNDYCEPCYCERCENAFRSWLKGRHPSAADVGRRSFDEVRQPPTEKSSSRIEDPLVREWVRFRCETLGAYHAELCAHARDLKPDVILLGNPAYPRSSNSPYNRSVWPVLLGRQLNLLFAENDNFPGMEGGALVSQIRAYKRATAVGYRVISTVWRRNKLTGLGLPETPAEVGLQVAEAAANGGLPGTNWALRPTNENDRMRIDRADLREALAASLRFARETDARAVGARPVTDIAVLHTFASSAFDAAESDARVLAAEEVLIRGGFSWETVFGEDMSRLKGFTALVIAGQSHMSEGEREAVLAFVRDGGVAILVGENGVRDENGKPMSHPLFHGVTDNVIRIDPAKICGKAPAVQSHIELAEGWRSMADAIDGALGDRISARLVGSGAVAVSALEEDRRLLVHLVNYDSSPTPNGLSLRLGRRWKTAGHVQMRTPSGASEVLRIKDSAVSVPPFAIYAVLTAELGPVAEASAHRRRLEMRT